jgi:hypothetical protein
MNQPTKKAYQYDLLIQGLFYVPMMCFYLIGFLAPGAFFIAMILQFFVGVAQVSSGTCHALLYGDEKHKKYLTLAIAYLVFLPLGGVLMESMNLRGGEEVLIILFLFIIPVGIATWYYHLTWFEYKNAIAALDGDYRDQVFQEDILDDAML